MLASVRPASSLHPAEFYTVQYRVKWSPTPMTGEHTRPGPTAQLRLGVMGKPMLISQCLCFVEWQDAVSSAQPELVPGGGFAALVLVNSMRQGPSGSCTSARADC